MLPNIGHRFSHTHTHTPKISRWKIRGRKRNAGLVADKEKKKGAWTNKNNSHECKSAVFFPSLSQIMNSAWPLVPCKQNEIFSHSGSESVAQHIRVRRWWWEISVQAPLADSPPSPPLSPHVWDERGLSSLGCVRQRTWREAHQGAVGQRVVAVHLEVDWDGVQDGLQVLLLLQAAGGVWRRGRSCKHNDGCCCCFL